MALVTYRRTSLLGDSLRKVATENGFVDISGSPLLGSIIRSVENALSTAYSDLYDIAKNVDIGRATGSYLDRWGNLLGEPRGTVGFASDMSLTNTSISIVPEKNAGEITIDAQGITIPEGTILSDERGMYSVATIGDAYMLPNRSTVYVKVIATDSSIDVIPTGALKTVQLSLSQIPNVASGAVKRYRLVAQNVNPITGGHGVADDELYRYILKESASSLWLFNDARIRKLMDILDVRNVIIDEYRGGAIVYIETVEPNIATQVAAIAQRHLEDQKPIGLAIKVSPVILRRLAMTIQLSFSTGDVSRIASIQTSFANNLAQAVNVHYAGEVVDVQSIFLSTLERFSEDINGGSIVTASVDGRTLFQFAVPQQPNQKLYLDPTAILFGA